MCLTHWSRIAMSFSFIPSERVSVQGIPREQADSQSYQRGTIRLRHLRKASCKMYPPYYYIQLPALRS